MNKWIARKHKALPKWVSETSEGGYHKELHDTWQDALSRANREADKDARTVEVVIPRLKWVPLGPEREKLPDSDLFIDRGDDYVELHDGWFDGKSAVIGSQDYEQLALTLLSLHERNKHE